MEIAQPQISHLMKRFPEFELSYETISHKKVSSKYNICLAIPTGKKAYVWFTFHQDKDVCYLFELNKERKINKASFINVDFKQELAHGTILYGTIVTDESSGKPWFIFEDIIYFRGIAMKKMKVAEKIEFMNQTMDFITNSRKQPTDFMFYLPMIWETVLTDGNDEYPAIIPPESSNAFSYQIHHIQYRAAYETMPYLNVFLNRKIGVKPDAELKKQAALVFETMKHRMDLSKPQYRMRAVFQVNADIQFDIYHLFAYGKNKMPIYYDVAYIPNYKSSIMMNGLFRNIRENKNLDFIEESDDEEDFQNMAIDKYVDVNKTLLMEFMFNSKFKRWVPIKVVDSRFKVVHISQL
jgi:hypothetical protein